MTTHTFTFALAATLAAAGCKKGEDKPVAASSSPSAPATASAPKPVPSTPAVAKSCADYGGEGKGDFGDTCRIKGKSPFVVKWTGGYEERFGQELPVFEITSNFDRPVTWGNISYWYYDKDGKLLDVGGVKRGYENGSGLLELAPGETKRFKVGTPKPEQPAATATIVAEVTGWGWETKPEMFFSAFGEVDNLDERPFAGWP